MRESLMIIFSVLFALFINKAYDHYQTQQRKKEAIENIIAEMKANEEILADWLERHQKIQKNLHEIVEGRSDSLKNRIIGNGYFDFSALTDGQSLIDANIQSTAWETAKSIGIISEFSFELTKNLTDVYAIQNIIMDNTIKKIVDAYFEAGGQGNDELIVKMHMLFSELVGQEHLLVSFYEGFEESEWLQ